MTDSTAQIRRLTPLMAADQDMAGAEVLPGLDLPRALSNEWAQGCHPDFLLTYQEARCVGGSPGRAGMQRDVTVQDATPPCHRDDGHVVGSSVTFTSSGLTKNRVKCSFRQFAGELLYLG